MTADRSGSCCWHGTADSADYCCLCMGDPCHLATVECLDITAHDARIAREAMEDQS